MSGKIKNPLDDGRDADVLDKLCAWRPCLQIGEDKGSFTPGVGYTSYHDKPRLVCMTRHCNGCPTPLPEPDPERARCCPAPELATLKRGLIPLKQQCRTCGKWHQGWALEAVRKLPVLPHTRCRHEEARFQEWPTKPAWLCMRCQLWFDKKPGPYELGRKTPQA